MVYLFIGQDRLSKDIRLKGLRQEFLTKEVEQFNLDILYAKELKLRDLQERLLCLPVKAKKRVIVIKDTEALKEEIKEFILKYVLNPYPQIALVLDINQRELKDEFINRLSKYAQVYHFREIARPDTFTLSRQIDLGRPDYALRMLSQLLKNGERPEWILGGLRFSWEKNITHPLQRRRGLKLLLNCDRDIKSGRLKALFALERLVVSLCCLNQP